MTRQQKNIDWAGALRRLGQIRESIEEAGRTKHDRAFEIFQERARRLAQPNQAAAELASDMLVVFRLAGERFAFRVSEVTEILPEFKLTPVPGAPAAIAGVIQVRGEIRLVYRLHAQLGLPEDPGNSSTTVLLLQAGDRRFGVQVEAVDEIRAVGSGDRRLPGESKHIAWVTKDLVRILDTNSLWKKDA